MYSITVVIRVGLEKAVFYRFLFKNQLILEQSLLLAAFQGHISVQIHPIETRCGRSPAFRTVLHLTSV